VGNVRTIIFSKDRAMQLDLLLRSMERYAPQLDDVWVIWKADVGSKFEEAYYNLFKLHKLEPRAWRQNDFMNPVQLFTAANPHPYIQFLVDDCVFYRPLDFYAWTLEPNSAYAPRLGLNCNWCGNIQVPQQVPTQLWREVGGEGDRDFDCTWSMDGHIYPKQDVQPFIDRGRYSNPNELEAEYCGAIRPRLYFPQHSCLTNIPHNSVGPYKDNRHLARGDEPVRRLNDMFLDGWRIKQDLMNFDSVNSCHMDIAYVMERGDNSRA
jgi:hypothetical protein